MLSNHVQSMFEYLAPRRGGGGGGGGPQGPGGGPHPPQPQPHHGKPPNNDGYKEMVYWEETKKKNLDFCVIVFVFARNKIVFNYWKKLMKQTIVFVIARNKRKKLYLHIKGSWSTHKEEKKIKE